MSRDDEATRPQDPAQHGRPGNTPGTDAPSAAKDPKRFETTAFDAEGALETAEAARPKRRRGRPPKARARTVFDNTPITSDEMAFLRATVQGVSPHRAALQFLASEAHQDGRAARPYLRQLLDRLHDAAERIQTLEPAQHRAVLAELKTLRREAADPVVVPAQPPELSLAATGSPAPPAPPVPPVPPAPGSAAALPAPAKARAARARPPTLEEFAERFDPDMFSEAELIERYQEEYPEDAGGSYAGDSEGDDPGVAPVTASAQPQAALAVPAREEPLAAAPLQRSEAPAPVPRVRHALDVDSRLAMVDELAQLVAIKPTADGPLSVWLGEKLAAAMRENLGLTRLAQLTTYVNEHGTTWHKQIKLLGPARAARLAVWLDRHAEHIGVPLRGRILAVLGPRAAAETGGNAPPAAALAKGGGSPGAALQPVAPRALSYGLVPLEDLDWPVNLLGEDGEFRGPTVNAYRATNDREAQQAWVQKAVASMALPSQVVVHRAIERLVLWALVERKLALSSLGTPDLLAFREFLYEPPAYWCGRDRVLRGSEDWRPLRGPLKAAGVRQIIVFVRQMYADWYASGYLRLDPAHKLSHHRFQTKEQRDEAKLAALEAAKKMTMNVGRSFVRQDLEAMVRELDAMEDVPTTRRLRAILSLYLDSGLRRSEVDMLTFGTPVPVRLDNELSGWLQITVLGKGDKPRTIPILQRTMDALEAHLKDRLQLIESGKLPHTYRLEREQTPVLSILQPMRRAAGQAGPGMTPADAPRKENKDGRLSAGSIAGLLKEFFKRVAVNQHEHLVAGQADFHAASTHWLRHTFAHRLLYEAGAKLPTVQKLLGHQSLATTGLYVEADMAERVRAVAQLKPVF